MRKVYMPLESTNIGLVVEMPTAEVFGPVLQMRNAVLPILIVGLAFLTLVGFGLVRRITIPIEKLTDISNSMSTGNLGVKADIKSNDEIGALASAFNRMAKNLKDRTVKLKASEEKYRVLFENANDAIFIADAVTGNLLFANEMAEKLTGRNRRELVGMHQSKLHPKEKFAYHKKIFTELINSDNAIDIEAEVERKDGTIVPVLISASVFEIGDRKITQSIFRDITERKRAEDELLRKFLRYRVEKGEVYFIKEQNPDLSIEVFKDILSCGFSGTVFSRAKKEEIEEGFGKVKSFWLAENAKAKDAIKPRFSDIESRIKAIGTGNNAVLLDRMDYLISKNGFDATLKFVQRLFEQAYLQRLIVILALDPQTLSPLELRQLEKETKRVEPKVKSRLPEDIYEILKFVYSENRVGVYPSYKDIYEKFKITRTTARNRIKRLKAMKFLVDRKRGRTKILEITDEGRDQF
ncbi:MAG: PAS domain S-box protein, partial [bacterium]